MAGLDKIIERINQDSAAKCDGILAEAESKATEILDAAAKTAKADTASVLADAEKQAKATVDMAESGSQMERKQAMLAAKVENIDSVVDAARAKLHDLPDSEYFDSLCALAAKYAQSGKGIMHLSQKDLLRMPFDFLTKVNSKLSGGEIELSKEPANVADGFVLSYGDVEINCTFDALISEQRDAIKDELYQLIFA